MECEWYPGSAADPHAWTRPERSEPRALMTASYVVSSEWCQSAIECALGIPIWIHCNCQSLGVEIHSPV